MYKNILNIILFYTLYFLANLAFAWEIFVKFVYKNVRISQRNHVHSQKCLRSPKKLHIGFQKVFYLHSHVKNDLKRFAPELKVS